MSKTALFSASELAQAANGIWRNGTAFSGKAELVTDSRMIQPHQCFVALVGERFDGHDYLESVKNAGALCAVIAEGRPAPEGFPVLEVKDTLRAYQALAAWHRKRFPNLKVAAVTGSVGKTSVKEMLRAIFTEVAGYGNVLYTIGNTNNQIGVAQNLLRLNRDHRYAVIEMGTNHPGEIAPLTAMAKPDAALINSIAPCHLEFLGDLAGVAREKASIYGGLEPGVGCAVYPVCAPEHEILAEAASAYQSFCFGPKGTPNARVTGEYRAGSLSGSRIRLHFADGQTEEFDWDLTGEHQAVNAAAAATLAWSMHVSPEKIVAGLCAATLPGQRMNREERNGALWINDAYNANPESMKSSLAALQRGTPETAELLLVLGDMLELGEKEEQFHLELLQSVAKDFRNRDYHLWLLGPRMGKALTQYGKLPETWRHFERLEALQKALSEAVHPGMTIFLKSSNSIGLGRVEAC